MIIVIVQINDYKLLQESNLTVV